MPPRTLKNKPRHKAAPLIARLLALTTTCFISQAYAADYFVSPLGDNSQNGSEASPFRNIQKAANIIQPGDTVYIKAGVYKERVVVNRSGLPEKPLTFTKYQQDSVTIDGKGIDWGGSWNGLFDVSGQSYIDISGIQLVNASFAGFFAENAHYINIRNSKTHNTYSSGIGIWQSDHIILDANEVSLACNDGGEESITISETTYFTVSQNHVHDNGPGTNGGEGIDVKEGSHHGKIINNRVHDLNNRPGIYIDAWDKFTHDIEVIGNEVYNNSESGISLASEMGGRLQNVAIHNNIVYGNKYGGIELGGWLNELANNDGRSTPLIDIRIINNTAYDNQEGVNIDNAYARNIVVRNNILSHNDGPQITISKTPLSEVQVDHNLVDRCASVAEDYCGKQAVVADPRFIQPKKSNFHLRPDSPAIDRGSATLAPTLDFSGTPRPKNQIWDIGAYESNPGVSALMAIYLLLDKT